MKRHSLGFQSSKSVQQASGLAAAVLTALAAGTSFAQQQPPAATRPPAAAAQQTPSLVAKDLEEITATVTAVDPAKRLISLKTEDGREVTVEAGEEVRNFSQIEVGDQVDVQFYRSLAAELTKATAAASDEPVLLGARAAEGDKPAGAAGAVYTAIVTVDSVDPATSTVRFTGPEGKQRETTAQREEGKQFVSQLKPGDRVQLTYAEAFAVAVGPSDEERALR